MIHTRKEAVMKKLIFLFILGSVGAWCQAPPPSTPQALCQVINCYTASTGSVSLSGAGTAATIQQPSTCNTTPGSCQQVIGIKATVQCSVACTVTRTKDGTVASATSAQSSIVQSPAQPQGTVTPLMKFFTASNASGGTTIDVVNVPAGGMQTYDLSDVFMPANGASQTYTISVSSITGTANITFYVGLK
jgi:hypothetical protein